MSPVKAIKAFLAFVTLTAALGTIAYYGKGEALGATPWQTYVIMGVVSAVGVILWCIDTKDDPR